MTGAPEGGEGNPERWAALARLREWVVARRVVVGVNIGLLNRPGSPVFRRIETALPVGTTIFAVIVAFAVGGPHLGLLCLVFGLVGLFFMALPRVRNRVYNRALDYAFADPANLDRLWAMGAVSLADAAERGHELVAPAGDWAAFRPRAGADAPATEMPPPA